MWLNSPFYNPPMKSHTAYLTFNLPQRLGFMKGLGKIPDDFDTMYAKEIEDLFYSNGKL